MNIFGGGFTGSPNSQCKLRQGMQQQQQQFTSPVVKVGNLPGPTFGVVPQPPAPSVAPQQASRTLGVQPHQNVHGFARPVMSAPPPPPIQVPAPAPAPAAAQSPSIYVQGNSPMGPTSYKVMKKGEAPCPICRG